ncbi:hepatocyte growth factor receptor-like [Dreissena polymorpha]|uniref:hepatocyte growth factor receptor-like n=1 Tax=Dreissena polymorpha TaxID=45954 RepID=UPI002264ED6F|nr:hepatocyte growth factor receptor-like [Dreissena polymorpha]
MDFNVLLVLQFCSVLFEGQMCDTCKDTFYDLKTNCSKSCNCSIAGSANLTCDKTSGQCNCIQEPTQPNRQCTPLISSITPEFGPLAGGTDVTITGELFENHTVKPIILIGVNAQVFRSRTSNSIVFKTKKSHNGFHGNISIRWSSNETTKAGATFEYRPDTTLSVSNNIMAYASGGCNICFNGTDLDSVKYPRLVVYLDKGKPLESECSSNGTECPSTGDKFLYCKTPNILTSITTNITLNFGFKLDGIGNYTNISDYRFVAFRDPVVNKNIKQKLDNTFGNGLIEVTGDGLNYACNDADIKITVGETPCSIQSRSDAKITCKINEKFPGKSRTEEIRVTIGNFTSVFGTVELLSFWYTIGFYHILGGVCLCVVIMLVVVSCCCYRRRKSKGAEEPGFLDTECYERKTRSGNYHIRMTPAVHIEMAPLSAILSSASGTVPAARSVLAPTTSFLSPTPTSNTASHKVAFCDRLDESDAKLIESSVVLREHVELSKNPRFTNQGKLSRVIDGQFSDSSSRSTVGRNLTIKVLNERYPETGPIPEWLVKELCECTRFRDFYNDHVLRMMGIAIDATKVYILYEEMENRTLKEYMIMSTKDKVIPSVDLMELCLQVAEGMEYLSTLAVVHKDLACRNCWVGKERLVKVADNSFSADLFSKEYMSENGSMVPVRWMAPESLKQGFFDAKSDIWSFGVLMWEVFTDCEYLPFYEIEKDNDVKKKVCFEDYKLVSPESGKCVANLMQDCFTTLGRDRPSFRDIINRLLNTISPGARELRQ